MGYREIRHVDRARAALAGLRSAFGLAPGARSSPRPRSTAGHFDSDPVSLGDISQGSCSGHDREGAVAGLDEAQAHAAEDEAGEAAPPAPADEDAVDLAFPGEPGHLLGHVTVHHLQLEIESATEGRRRRLEDLGGGLLDLPLLVAMAFGQRLDVEVLEARPVDDVQEDQPGAQVLGQAGGVARGAGRFLAAVDAHQEGLAHVLLRLAAGGPLRAGPDRGC